MIPKILREWIMNVGEIEEKLEGCLKLEEGDKPGQVKVEPSDENAGDENGVTNGASNAGERKSIPIKVQTRIPRPSGIKAPSGIPRILSCSAQRPVSTTNSPISLKANPDDSSQPTSPGGGGFNVITTTPPPAPSTNRSISYTPNTVVSSSSQLTSPLGNHQRITSTTSKCITSPTSHHQQATTPARTEYSNHYSISSSNNSQFPDTESQGSSGSRRSSSNYSYISLGEPRMINAKINSLANLDHVPGGGNIKIFNQKIDTSSVGAKCGSKANMNYKPGGGDIKIVNEKVDIKAESKTKSLKNVKHVPGGGDKKIYNETLPWLKYNAPKLSADEKKRITKHQVKLQP